MGSSRACRRAAESSRPYSRPSAHHLVLGIYHARARTALSPGLHPSGPHSLDPYLGNPVSSTLAHVPFRGNYLEALQTESLCRSLHSSLVLSTPVVYVGSCFDISRKPPPVSASNRLGPHSAGET